MTQQQIISEFERFSKAEKSAIMRQLLQILERDLTDENIVDEAIQKPFAVTAFKLGPRREFDFDNIGRLLEEAEGDSHK